MSELRLRNGDEAKRLLEEASLTLASPSQFIYCLDNPSTYPYTTALPHLSGGRAVTLPA